MFGLLTAFTYLLASWQNGVAVGECFGRDSNPTNPNRVCIAEMGEMEFGFSNFVDAMSAGIHSALLSPIGIAFYGLIIGGFWFFTDKRSTCKFPKIIGMLHAASHILAGFYIYWFSVYIVIHKDLMGLAAKSIPQYLMTGSFIFILSWVIGSFILGIYLLASLNLFKMHKTEAFSSLRIQDWKGFLRFRIDKDGTLNMKVIGFKKVPRHWKTATLSNKNKIDEPENPSDFLGKVIDEIDIP